MKKILPLCYLFVTNILIYFPRDNISQVHYCDEHLMMIVQLDSNKLCKLL